MSCVPLENMLDNALGAVLTVVNDELEFSLIKTHKNSDTNSSGVPQHNMIPKITSLI